MLPQIHYLVIVPHKELHSIPFEVIQHKNQYWGLKYGIVKNFSLDLSRITLQKRVQYLESHPKMKHSALIAGNPTMDLKNAEVEAQEVKNMLKQKGFSIVLSQAAYLDSEHHAEMRITVWCMVSIRC